MEKAISFILMLSFMLGASACGAARGATGQGTPEPTRLAAQAGTDALFSDVPADAWYAEAIRYCQAHGIMEGTGGAAFSPNASMTRAALAAILYRAAGAPSVEAAPDFTDTAPGAWYSGAVSWAVETGVLSGYGNGAFGADDPVTREQMAAVLWRYAGSPAGAGAEAFSDAASISAWAQPAVNWARSGGILTGRAGNRFDPKAAVTRGEAAVILYRCLERDQAAKPSSPGGDLILSVGEKRFTVELEENASARGLAERLPLTVTMGELNGNEKYYYLPEALPTAPERPGEIQAGDLMLYGSDCLVLFYESFSTSYAYTRLGRITDPKGLAEAVGSGEVEVTFQMGTLEGKTAPSGLVFSFETKPSR